MPLSVGQVHLADHAQRVADEAGAFLRVERHVGGAPFGNLKSISLPQITDGSSSTLLAAEVIQGQGRDLRGFTWWGDGSEFTTFLGPNSPLPDRIYTADYCKSNPPNPPCAASTSALPNMFGARSRHTGGVQAVFGDGHVQMVNDSINLSTWRAMSTTQGGEVINEN